MKHGGMIFILSLLVLILAGNYRSENQAKAGSGRPNIIIVMADDMGFSDLARVSEL